MDYLYYLFILFGFLAVVFTMDGAYLAWNSTKGPEAQRMERRLRAASAGEHGGEVPRLMKQRAPGDLGILERMLLKLPRIHELDRLLLQAGTEQSVSHFVMVTLIAALAGLLLPLLMRWPLWSAIAVGIVCGLVPLTQLLRARHKRLRAFEEQLPDALDLMGRALRAGHAFSGALKMVSSESNDPIAGEFRITFDEVNYGIPMQDALLNLATRVPSLDLRYFVIAVLLQRDTGGNLAELLDKLSALIRARFKLLGTIRVLSAEGRLSAWILSLLPFVAAALLNILNPKLMSVLWTDPAGMKLIITAAAMMVLGIFWMWRIVKIRV